MAKVPSVGRTVHYTSYGTPGGEYPSVCRAAVVTEVPVHHDIKGIHLCVLNPEGMFFNKNVQFDITGKGGTWHWPEYVPDDDR